VAFSDIPYFSFENTRYFRFVYDLQESGSAGSEEVSIGNIEISVVGISDPDSFWSFNDTILLNSKTPYSNSPLENGGDLELNVPVSLFVDYELTGSNEIIFTITQTLSDDGKDEWVLLSSGNFFDPEDPIVVPIPPAVWLFGTGLLGLGLLGRRRKNRT
jgi:hypothetical protein